MNKHIIRQIITILLLISFNNHSFAQMSDYLEIARIKYSGGGDWYNDPSAEVNLLEFIEESVGIKTNAKYTVADLNTREIFNYPITFLTGHGNVVFSSDQIKTLREYFENGGFMFIDDDYGLDKSIRRELKKLYPSLKLVELPFNHDIYNCFYQFDNGPPKTHEHDNKPPKGFGLFLGERLIIYYLTESNPSDGWANQDIHNNPEAKRQEALQFGTNIIIYALSN